MLKKGIAVVLTVITLFTTWISVVPVCGVQAGEADTACLPGDDAYNQYIADKAEYKHGTPLEITADTPEKLEGSAVITQDGIEFRAEGDSASWTVKVPENTLYQPMFTYTAIDHGINKIGFSLQVDSAYPYPQAEAFFFTRLWKNKTNQFQTDQNGNEFSPEQMQVYADQTSAMWDDDGFITTPLAVALEAGTHTITLQLKSEAACIKKVVLDTVEELLPYEQYRKKIADHTEYHGEEIVIQGETAEWKSANRFLPLNTRNDAEVTPSDPYRKKNNYIGGSNWNTLYDTISWEVEIKQAGWYKIGFLFRQNYLQEGTSYRRLLIDGKTPFQEAEECGFDYHYQWQEKTLSDQNGNNLPIYLNKGNHTIGLSVTLGALSSSAARLKTITDRLGKIYRKIVKITGESPDAGRDYAIFTAIPELEGELTEISALLTDIADYSEKTAGKKGGSNAQVMRKAVVIMNQMLKSKYEAHTKLTAFYDNYSSLCSWVYEMQNMALDIDALVLTQPQAKIRQGKVSFLEKVNFSVKRLLFSYIQQYEDSVSASEQENSLVLWTNWGRDQITLIQNLISNDFTLKTGIDVKVKITGASLVQAGLAGNGPDFQINVAQTAPVNYAMRGLLQDLTKFEDYPEIIKRFSGSATLPYRYKKGVYGLPSTEVFNMMFIRTDVFDELELTVPKTWTDFINASRVIALNNMEVGMTADFNLFLAQMGVPLYNEDLTATNLTSPEAVKAIEFCTDFYTKYKLPVTYSLFNRFRIGLMPMAIAPYSENATFRAAAPEISGKWEMVELPGFQNENGEIINNAYGTGTACVILKWSKNKEKAWEFLKWWTSDDIQYRFSVNIESILGSSGRYTSANLNAVYQLPWDTSTLRAIQKQYSTLTNFPQIPGGYYVERSTKQVYWNVVNNAQNVEDMLEKWIPEANDEIRRKTEEYAK